MNTLIRLEEPKDYRVVEELTRDAFWNLYRPGCQEHYILNQYRRNSDFIPELDLVMEEDGTIIGHVMFSKAQLFDDQGQALPLRGVATFGPMSIHPDYKRKGYGLRLLKYALGKAKLLGLKLVCIEGNIDFYRHAGFVVASTLGIHYHIEPKDAEVPYFLAQELEAGFLGGIEATYHTPQGYLVVDMQPKAFEAYESEFPIREKHLQPGQLPQFCQSCAMPLQSEGQLGTDADGRINFDYCKYCYQNGEFIDKVTMEEYIDMCAQFGAQAGMTNEEMRCHCEAVFPMLRRWRKR